MRSKQSPADAVLLRTEEARYRGRDTAGLWRAKGDWGLQW